MKKLSITIFLIVTFALSAFAGETPSGGFAGESPTGDIVKTTEGDTKIVYKDDSSINDFVKYIESMFKSFRF